KSGRSDQPELLGERRVDEVRIEAWNDRLAVNRPERPLAEPGAGVLAVSNRVQRLHQLEALTVLAQVEMSGEGAVDLVRRPGVDPDRHALADMRSDPPHADRADEEETQPGGDVRDARRGDVEHGKEDSEVEEAASEIPRLQ